MCVCVCVPLISTRKVIALILMLISLNLSREQSTNKAYPTPEPRETTPKSCFLNSNWLQKISFCWQCCVLSSFTRQITKLRHQRPTWNSKFCCNGFTSNCYCQIVTQLEHITRRNLCTLQYVLANFITYINTSEKMRSPALPTTWRSSK